MLMVDAMGEGLTDGNGDVFGGRWIELPEDGACTGTTALGWY